MKKRVLALLLAAVMLFALPVSAWAAATSGTTGQARWSYDRSTRTLTFSGTGSTGDYNYFTGSGDSYYPYADYLYTWKSGYAQKAVVEEGITRVGDCFLASSGVTEVVFPKSLTAIGPRAFIFCNSLKTINIPVSVKTIEMNAFSQCGYASGNKNVASSGLTINYEGTRAQWAQISVKTSTSSTDNALANATIHFLGDTPYPGTPFTDINNHWGAEAIKWAYEGKLFSGVSESQFGPTGAMDRGMLVTVLHRLAGEPAASGTGSFYDVPGDRYYAKAVSWASENGIVQGIAAGAFGPGNPITREQLAQILYGYAVKFGKDTSGDSTALSRFSDRDSVSGWAVEAVQWAASHEVLKGSGGRLNPKGSATRAEVAQVFYNCRDLLA